MIAAHKQVKASKVQMEVTRARRLAGTVAAMVQINMGYYQYLQAVDLHRNAEELNAVDRKLLDLTAASTKAREAGMLDHIRQSALTVNSRLERDRTLVEVFSAWGNLYFSVGGDILGDVSGYEELDELTAIAQEAMARWLAGGLPPLPDDATDAPSLPGGRIAAAPAPTVVDITDGLIPANPADLGGESMEPVYVTPVYVDIDGETAEEVMDMDVEMPTVPSLVAVEFIGVSTS